MTARKSAFLPRYSRQAQEILDLMSDGQEWYGAQLSKACDVPSGTLYPLLIRLVDWGLLSSRWEDVDQQILKRPRRRYYRRVWHQFPATDK